MVSTQLIRSLAVKNLSHLFAVIWLSVIMLLGVFGRPDMISAIGARGWSLIIWPLIVLLYVVWISFVILLRQDAGLFQTTHSAQANGRKSSQRRSSGGRSIPDCGNAMSRPSRNVTMQGGIEDRCLHC